MTAAAGCHTMSAVSQAVNAIGPPKSARGPRTRRPSWPLYQVSLNGEQRHSRSASPCRLHRWTKTPAESPDLVRGSSLARSRNPTAKSVNRRQRSSLTLGSSVAASYSAAARQPPGGPGLAPKLWTWRLVCHRPGLHLHCRHARPRYNWRRTRSSLDSPGGRLVRLTLLGLVV